MMTALMLVKRNLINKINQCLLFSILVCREAVPRSATCPVHHSFLGTILRIYRRPESESTASFEVALKMSIDFISFFYHVH